MIFIPHLFLTWDRVLTLGACAVCVSCMVYNVTFFLSKRGGGFLAAVLAFLLFVMVGLFLIDK